MDGVDPPVQQANKDLLRFLTCGSVDDGKSTLIGRLLHDSKQIFEDQLSELTRESTRRGTAGDQVDLSLLVDGLEAEREQGITIDVAYRFFSTPKRSFTRRNNPGHASVSAPRLSPQAVTVLRNAGLLTMWPLVVG